MDRSAQIEVWLRQHWRRARDTGALWQNIRGYNVSVVEDDSNPGVWKWRLTPLHTSNHTYSDDCYFSEEAAKRAVLEELADRLGL